MMNFGLSQIPERTQKPRQFGLTMVMDKGLCLRETENFVSNSEHITDLVKLAFGSAMVTPHLEEKLKIYREANIPVCFGGTLGEAFIVRNQFDDFLRLLDKYKMEYAELSDGSISIDHDLKCQYIKKLSEHITVLSEVGSKEEGIMIRPNLWIEMMQTELEAGAWKVIAEARESGTVGIYRPNGKAHVVLINKIIAHVKPENIIWEAPQKSQQAWFIKIFGANVNLGNISPTEIIALESLRLGLRGDTFSQFLDESITTN